MSDQAPSNLVGFRPEPDSDKHWSYEDRLKSRMTAQVTGDVNLRPFSTPRHHQLNSSSCVANAVVKALEIKRVMHQSGHHKHVDLSRLAVYYLARELMMPPETHVDGGTYISHACDVLRRFGVCREEDWPFDLSKINTAPSWRAMRKAYTHKIESFFKIRSTGTDRCDEVIRCLQAGNPVVFGTDVGRNWSQYTKGQVLKCPDTTTGRHATVIVGIQDGKFIGENSWGCYDAQTEVLTREGWVLFSALQGDEHFATLNPSTHGLEYQQTSKVHEYEYDGDLLHFQKQGVDLLVTPNHRMYVTNHHKRHLPGWPIVRADSIDGSRTVCFKKDAANNSPDVDFFEIAGVSVEADRWLEFLGYFISEGSTAKHSFIRTRTRTRPYALKGGVLRDGTTGQFFSDPEGVPGEASCTYTTTYGQTNRTVQLSQTVGPNGERIAQCLKSLPFHFREDHKSAQGRRKAQRVWTHTTKGLFQHLAKQGKAPDKHIPREYQRLSSRQSRILFDALMLGDGTKSGSWTYYTSSKQLADDVQELSLRCGYAADIGVTDRTDQDGYTHLEYRVGIKRTRVRPQARHVPAKVPYKGKVYCVTVPNGLVYVRRAGQAVWCGNSNWGDDGFYLMDPSVISCARSKDFWVIQNGYEEYVPT